jgi:hypothetical protein
VTDHRRYREMSDEELEGLVQGLPRREPGAALRERVLGRVSPSPAGRSPALRPVVVAACVALLLLADILVVRMQGSRPASAAPAAGAPTRDVDTAWLREVGASGMALRLTMVSAEEPREASPVALRRLLENCEGG